MNESTRRILRGTGLVGLVLVVCFGLRAASMPALVLMLAPGVIVPLGLAFALESGGELPPFLSRALLIVAPLGAVVGVLGWLARPGESVAIAAAAVHAGTCLLAAAIGAFRLWRRRREGVGPLPEIAIDVGLLLLAVAGVWFVACRAGESLLGFHEPVVTFTAAHFHYAGFAAPVVVGGIGRLDADAQRGWRYRLAAVGVCLGVPATAVGILASHAVEVVAAFCVAGAMLATSSLLVWNASRRAAMRSWPAAMLFVVAGATLLLTMTLASAFALTSSAGRGSTLTAVVPLQTMIDWHGGANALGFALPALAALTLLGVSRKPG